jgi:hypothetical protein
LKYEMMERRFPRPFRVTDRRVVPGEDVAA